jgi:hypothetical protein
VGGAALRESLRADAGVYASCYCEENVARRLAALPEAERRHSFALVISNARRAVAVAHQRAGDASRGGLVVWDYHVIALSHSEDEAGSGWFAWDLDSTLLPFPAPARAYLAASFPPSTREQHRACFRLAGADLYLARFASTRRHMRGHDGESWLAPPPAWPCLQGADAEGGVGDNLALWLPPAAAGGTATSVDAGYGADALGVDALIALLERVSQQRGAKNGGAAE